MPLIEFSSDALYRLTDQFQHRLLVKGLSIPSKRLHELESDD